MNDDLLDGHLIKFQRAGDLIGVDFKEVGRIYFVARLGNIVAGTKLAVDSPLPDGRYRLLDKNVKYQIVNNTMVEEFYIERFKLRNGAHCTVDCSRVSGFCVGSSIYSDELPLPDGIYRLKLLRWVAVAAGKIEKIGLFANSVT